MIEKSIEITVQPAYRKFNYIYIPVQHTGYSPPGTPKTRMPVEIETDNESLHAELQYNNEARV
jgi:hypothetical protein